MSGAAAAAESAELVNDIFSTSDEDFATRGDDFLAPPEVAEDEVIDNTDGLEDEASALADEDVTDNDEEDNEEESTEIESEATSEEDEVGEGDEGTDSTDEEASDEESTESEDESESDQSETDESTIDYEKEYNSLLASFKANGKDMKVDSVDDARKLMQMGANYNKKMSALKPNMKVLKTLEKHELLGEGKLDFLIDLNEGNPDAIAKLLKDKGIDPMELNLEEEGNDYQPAQRSIDDREVELDSVLDELSGSETYDRTLNVVGTEWDNQSKQIVAEQPQLLKVIDDHMANGIYDLISTEVEKERVFGRLSGVSDIHAYRQIGDAMQDSGAFNHLFSEETATDRSSPKAAAPKPKAKDDSKRRDKRRAASPSKPAAPSSGKADYNPLNMSDEEFEKLDPSLM